MAEPAPARGGVRPDPRDRLPVPHERHAQRRPVPAPGAGGSRSCSASCWSGSASTSGCGSSRRRCSPSDCQRERSCRLPSIEVIKQHWKPIGLSALARMSEQAPFYVISAFTLTYLTGEQGTPRRSLSPRSCRLRPSRWSPCRSSAICPTRSAARRSTSWRRPDRGLRVRPVLRPRQRGRGGGLPGHADRADPARHAVRPAGLADRGVVPDLAAVRRRRARYQLASVIAGGPAPLVATYLLQHTGSVYSIAWAVLGCSVITIVAVRLMADRSARTSPTTRRTPRSGSPPTVPRSPRSGV